MNMTLEKVTDMTQVKHNLNNLADLMPDEERITYDLAKYISTRLNPELVPIGFNMAIELIFYDLRAGKSGFDWMPIPNSLIGYPPMIYSMLKMNLPKIIRNVCSKEFGDEVIQIMDEVSDRSRKLSS